MVIISVTGRGVIRREEGSCLGQKGKKLLLPGRFEKKRDLLEAGTPKPSRRVQQGERGAGRQADPGTRGAAWDAGQVTLGLVHT